MAGAEKFGDVLLTLAICLALAAVILILQYECKEPSKLKAMSQGMKSYFTLLLLFQAR